MESPEERIITPYTVEEYLEYRKNFNSNPSDDPEDKLPCLFQFLKEKYNLVLNPERYKLVSYKKNYMHND